MTTYMYTTSVPVFKQLLNSLSAILTKAEALATEKKIWTDSFTGCAAIPRYVPLDPPSANRHWFCQERVSTTGRCRCTSVWRQRTELYRVAGTYWQDTVVYRKPNTRAIRRQRNAWNRVTAGHTEREKNGWPHLPVQLRLPQFFFHVTTAYAILRHNGLEVGKGDFMGAY